MADTASFNGALRTASLIWRDALIGGATVVAFVLIGWRAGRADHRWLIHPVRWWLVRVLGPVLGSGTWLRRSALIAANNSAICLVLVLLGWLGHLAWLGVAGMGLSLGIALRFIGADVMAYGGDEPTPMRNHRVLRAIGMMLNLLEVPAVILCIGLSLAQGALSSSLTLSSALAAFCYLALPLLAISAVGEATWMEFDRDIRRISPRA